jgi:PEP-CTERM motif
VLALALAFPAAQALPSVAAGGSFSDDADYLSTAKAGSFDQPATSTAFDASATGAATSYYDSSTTVRAVADGAGQFGTAIANTKSYGSFAGMTAASHIAFSDSIVNSSASAQNASFALNISEVAFDVFTGTMDGRNRGSFQAQVFVGNAATPVWRSGFSFDNAGGNTMAAATTGTDIGLASAFSAACAQHCSIFNSFQFASGYNTSLNLGSVAAGDSLTVRYVVDIATETDTYSGVSSVSFDDPAGLALGNMRPHDAALSFATPVPEPETVSLMAAGLGLMAAAARRRRRA